MKKYKSIVVDDDPISLKIFEKCIDRTGVFEQCLLLEDALSLKEHLKKEDCDVIFLDVELLNFWTQEPEIFGDINPAQISSLPKFIF